MSELLEMAKKGTRNGPINITYGNIDYADVVMNWVMSLRRLKIDNHLVISFDRALLDFLVSRSVPAAMITPPITAPPKSFFVHRIASMEALLRGGIAFIHSDADAVWLKDARFLFSGSVPDIVASQGTVWPPPFFDKHGFVMCMGLISLRPTAPTVELISKVRQRMEGEDAHLGSDQWSFNMQCLAAGPTPRGNAVEGYRLDVGPVKIQVLGKSLVSRTSQTRDASTLIHHPRSKKNQEDTLRVLKEEGIYFLNGD